jgi:hypothetical protein
LPSKIARPDGPSSAGHDSDDAAARKYQAITPLVIAGMIFGGIHCFAWNFSFPTQIERYLWRAACVVVTASVPVLALPFKISAVVYCPEKYPFWSRHSGGLARRIDYALVDNGVVKRVVALFDYGVLFMYCVARLYMLVEVFISPRSLPSSAYKTVDWDRIIPHIS